MTYTMWLRIPFLLLNGNITEMLCWYRSCWSQSSNDSVKDLKIYESMVPPSPLIAGLLWSAFGLSLGKNGQINTEGVTGQRNCRCSGRILTFYLLAVWAVYVSGLFVMLQWFTETSSSPYSPSGFGLFQNYLPVGAKERSHGYKAVPWEQQRPGPRLGNGQAVVPRQGWYHMSCRSSYFCFCSSCVLIIWGKISCPALFTAGFGSWATRLVCCWYNAAAELSTIATLLPVTLLKRALFVMLSYGYNKWPTFHSGELLCSCTVRVAHAPHAVPRSRKGLLLWTLQESIGRKVWVLLAASYPPAVHGALVLVAAEHGDQVVRPPQDKIAAHGCKAAKHMVR